MSEDIKKTEDETEEVVETEAPSSKDYRVK